MIQPCDRALRMGGFLTAFFLRASGALVLVSIFGFALACCGDAPGKSKTADPRKKMAVPVTVATAITKPVPEQLRAIGNVQAFATVHIRSRVQGELVGVHFKEGSEVKSGELLFTIDPRPFEAALKQAEANLAKNRAQLQHARKQTERYASVVKKGYVSEEQNDQILTNAATLEAAVRADEAAVENSRLDLKYCTIRSPITGVTGQLKVDRGNLIKSGDNDNPMVTIKQTSPIYVVFSVPEAYLPELKKRMAARPLEVSVAVSGDEERPLQGELTFLDNAVDQTTGTILLRSTFANQDRMLWPGQFVNVTLTLSLQPEALVIPSQAVQTGQQGRYVFVVTPESTAEYRLVALSRTVDGEAVVLKGVSPGERVVTDGQLRLTQGAQVTIIESGQAAGEDSRQ
jgi:multidrug efflux system membrane fusion protein